GHARDRVARPQHYVAGRRGVPPERGHARGITARSLAAAGGRITLKAWLFWIATIWLTLELLLGGFEDLTRGPAMIVTGDHVDTVVSSLGYPVYVLLFL